MPLSCCFVIAYDVVVSSLRNRSLLCVEANRQALCVCGVWILRVWSVDHACVTCIPCVCDVWTMCVWRVDYACVTSVNRAHVLWIWCESFIRVCGWGILFVFYRLCYFVIDYIMVTRLHGSPYASSSSFHLEAISFMLWCRCHFVDLVDWLCMMQVGLFACTAVSCWSVFTGYVYILVHVHVHD